MKELTISKKSGKLHGYKVCETFATNSKTNTYLGRMLSSGIDRVKCGWVMGRYLKNRKMIKVSSHDLTSPQPHVIPLH